MGENLWLGEYFTLEEFCTCSNTYRKYADRLDPYPRNPQSIEALRDLCQFLLDPIAAYFGKERLILTYGFCSADLKKFLAQKDPETGDKNGRVDPKRDQHIAYEIDKTGKYYCLRGGAASDFRIRELPSDRLVEWILAQDLPFDSLYFYGIDRPIHLSYGPQQKRAIWTFTAAGTPTRRGIEKWIENSGKGFLNQ